MSGNEDRRQDERFACDIETLVDAPEGRGLVARTQDISFSGICVLADQPVRAGARVTFNLRLILDWAESNFLALPGTVVWCTPVKGSHQIGARFRPDDIEDAQWQQLEVLLRFLAGELQLPQVP